MASDVATFIRVCVLHVLTHSISTITFQHLMVAIRCSILGMSTVIVWDVVHTLLSLPPNGELPLVHTWPRNLISETNQSSKISWSLFIVFKGPASFAPNRPARKQTMGFKWFDIPLTIPSLPIAKPSPKPGFAHDFCFHTSTNDYIHPLDEAKRALSRRCPSAT